MKSVWNDPEHRELQERVKRLTAQHAATWGTMNASQMVAHLSDAIRMASGELRVAPKSILVLRYPPLKQLVIYWLPFPKGAPTVPELIARQPGAWPAEIADLQHQLERFVGRGPRATAATHPVFGRLSGSQWGVLVYRHMDHHLRQFGV
jgi:hypothetical protein